jgi:hypothetical protein
MRSFASRFLPMGFAIAVMSFGTMAVGHAQTIIPAGTLSLPTGAGNGTPLSNNQAAVRAGIAAGGWTAVFGNLANNSTTLNNNIRATASNSNALNGYFPFRQTGPVNPLAISIPIGSNQRTAIDQEVEKLASTAQARAQLRNGILQAIRSGGQEVVIGGFRLKGGIATYSTFTTRTTRVPDGTQTVTEQVPDGTERYKEWDRWRMRHVWKTRPKFKTVTKQVPKFRTVTQQVPQGQFFEPYFAYRR